MDAVYNFVNDQGSTRQNYPDDGEVLKSVHDFSERNAHENGVYLNDAGVKFWASRASRRLHLCGELVILPKKAYAIRMVITLRSKSSRPNKPY